jgi:SpoVK/Ycf46/Vps4 family AAA+-type ATPase
MDKKPTVNNNQMSSSDKSDGGTTSRVIQSLLTWLSDKQSPVFVIATSNDITKLPAELTRAGRFDDIFFVSLPHQKEREDIFTIHLNKRGYEVNESGDKNAFTQAQIAELSEKALDFTGAEIEQVVSEAGRRAYAAFKKGDRSDHYIHQEDIMKQIEKIVPLSKRDPELLSGLRSWAKHSAKCASSEEHNLIHGSSNNDPKLVELDFPSGIGSIDI